MSTTTTTTNKTHILIFPYPAQGHMLPLLDLAHHLTLRPNLAITVLLTPNNLPFLVPHPDIDTLVLPLPPHPSIPPGIENVKDLPAGSGFKAMMRCQSGLYGPIVEWFRNHPSPPVAIISDMFLGWTEGLATELGIRRIVFSPSGALALSVISWLWREQPRRDGTVDTVVSFRGVPNEPEYPWWQISPIYRSWVEGEENAESEFIKDGFVKNMASWGLVINSFSELEQVYLDHLMAELGHERVWAVGPLLPPPRVESQSQRGGPTTVSETEILSWLDTCRDDEVVYVCFGSQAVLRNDQMEALGTGLEKSGVRFIWAVKEPTKGYVEGNYARVPPEFEDRVAERGLVLRGWVPQVAILRHRAVGAFLTHCGWNSVLESVVSKVPMLVWAMGADQFSNATLLVDELKVASRVCEGDKTVPNSDELGRVIAESVSEEKREERARAVELGDAALEAIQEGGSSYKDLDRLVSQLNILK